MKLKKLIADLICSPVMGKMFTMIFNKRIPSIRNSGYRFSVPVQYSSPVIHASIFWGIYESAEIRLIKKHLKSDLPVIELGGSLGVISSFIVSKLSANASLVVVEANPYLTRTIKKNIDRHNKNEVPAKILNKAIGYSASSVYMAISNDNTASHVAEEAGGRGQSIQVECTRLRDIILSGPYTLVCDIEGSEIEILFYDKEAMRNCRQLFIELHDTVHMKQIYTREALLKMLLADGFALKNRDGNVYFFERD